jgi:hypothetical protein
VADSLSLGAAQCSFSRSNTRAAWLKTAGRFYCNEFFFYLRIFDISGSWVGEGGVFGQEGAKEAYEKSGKHWDESGILGRWCCRVINVAPSHSGQESNICFFAAREGTDNRRNPLKWENPSPPTPPPRACQPPGAGEIEVAGLSSTGLCRYRFGSTRFVFLMKPTRL